MSTDGEIDVSLTADRLDRDVGLTAADETVNRHAPVRQVISVNGEEEDVENINIHDFTTFEQEQLIGPEFIGQLKRKSVSSEDDPERKLQRNLSSFRSAVRAVLSTEAIMQAMKHYNHRSDSETEAEEDDDESRTPVPTETAPRLDTSGNNPPTEHPCSVPGNPDVPVSQASVPNQPGIPRDVCKCQDDDDKPSVSDAAVNIPDSPLSVEQPDVLVPAMSVAKSGGVDVSAVQLADCEAASTTRTDVKTATDIVLNDTTSCEADIDAAEVSTAKTTVDLSHPRVLSDAGDRLSDPRAANESGDRGTSETSKHPTDGLMTVTVTTEQRPTTTETSDVACIQCCCVQ